MHVVADGAGDVGVVGGCDEHLRGAFDDAPEAFAAVGIEFTEDIVKDEDRFAVAKVAFFDREKVVGPEAEREGERP